MAKNVVLLLCLIKVLLFTTVFGYKSYQGYQVLCAHVAVARDAEILNRLEQTGDIDILNEIRNTGKVYILVEPALAMRVMAFLRRNHIKFTIDEHNFGSIINKEHARIQQSGVSRTGVAATEFDYTEYQSLATIHSHLKSLVAEFPNSAKLLDIGKSYEGRDILGLILSEDVQNSDNKPVLWLDGGIHAREWVSPSTVMFIIDALLGKVENDTTIRSQLEDIMKEFQIHIVPNINPDGYEYTRNGDRMWRKTRKYAGCKKNLKTLWGSCYYKRCYGSDPNRNWDHPDWGKQGVSTNPCSEVYPGGEPFDQTNTKMVSTYLLKLKNNDKRNIVLFVTYHSYSQLFLTPYGYTLDDHPEYAHHKAVGDAVVAAIKQRHGKTYINQKSAGLYPASGDSADWAEHTLGIVDSYTFELRPSAAEWRVGFELPKEQIRETGEENVSAFIALVNGIKYHQDKNST